MTREEAIKVIHKMLAYTDLSVRANLTADMVEACHLAIKALEQEPCKDATLKDIFCMGCEYKESTTKNDLRVDCIDRKATLDAIIKRLGIKNEAYLLEAERVIYQQILAMPPVTPQEPRWIPVSERLPKDLEPVNITWVNRNPESYYANIKDKPFTATGVYFNGQWYWWSALCTDTLAEYSHNYDDIIDDDIEITAWMPLLKPYSEVKK